MIVVISDNLQLAVCPLLKSVESSSVSSVRCLSTSLGLPIGPNCVGYITSPAIRQISPSQVAPCQDATPAV